jgi:hypothetical protein
MARWTMGEGGPLCTHRALQGLEPTGAEDCGGYCRDLRSIFGRTFCRPKNLTLSHDLMALPRGRTPVFAVRGQSLLCGPRLVDIVPAPTPHQFRHFGATSYLEQHPEDFETARAILGHSWSKTTRIYAGSSSRRASRAYNQHLLQQREAHKLLGSKRMRRR